MYARTVGYALLGTALVGALWSAMTVDAARFALCGLASVMGGIVVLRED